MADVPFPIPLHNYCSSRFRTIQVTYETAKIGKKSGANTDSTTHSSTPHTWNHYGVSNEKETVTTAWSQNHTILWGNVQWKRLRGKKGIKLAMLRCILVQEETSRWVGAAQQYLSSGDFLILRAALLHLVSPSLSHSHTHLTTDTTEEDVHFKHNT